MGVGWVRGAVDDPQVLGDAGSMVAIVAEPSEALRYQYLGGVDRYIDVS